MATATWGRVPMRGTEADRLVVVMKALQWGWSEGAGQARSPIGQPFGGGADGRITVGNEVV